MKLFQLNTTERKSKGETRGFVRRVLNRGFTLIELIVVIGIFTIIMAVALVNQNQLNSNILITNLAYEVALAIREAQAYGIGVRNVSGADNFGGGFGVSFSETEPNQIVLFNDGALVATLENGIYDAGEEKSVYTIENQRGNTITARCGALVPGTACQSPGHPQLSIVFRRPNPEARFYVDGSIISGPVTIIVNTPSLDNCRAIIVEQSGQIRVEGNTSDLCP